MAKRLVNLCISFLVGALDWVWRRVGRSLGRLEHGRCVVLAFHSVTAGERSRFGRQMDLLLRRAKPVRADIRVLPCQGGRYAAVTFDDGLECLVDNALPELSKRRIPVTVFVVTEALGRYPEWRYLGGDDPSKDRVMSEEQLRALPSELVAIGSHTMTHPMLPALANEQLSREILGSRLKLEQILNQEVKLLSFPYGAFDARAVELCHQAGYERVFTALPVFAFTDPEEYVSGRVGVAATDWPIEFRLKLAGAYRWLPHAYVWKHRILSRFSGQRITQTGRSNAEEKRIA